MPFVRGLWTVLPLCHVACGMAEDEVCTAYWVLGTTGYGDGPGLVRLVDDGYSALNRVNFRLWLRALRNEAFRGFLVGHRVTES